MKSLIILILTALTLTVYGENFSEGWKAVKDSGDKKKITEFLEKASAAEADNPDYYALAGNHWWQLAESLVISTKPPAGEDLSIRDQKTGEEVGSISSAAMSDPALRGKALGLISEGARRFPERADLVLGLANIQKTMGKDAEAVATLIGLLETAATKKLKWTENMELPSKAETFIPEAIQGYTAGLYEAESLVSGALCTKLCEAVIEAYPEHPYAYNIKAALASAQGKPEDALKFLGIASEKAPDDPLILMNLGDALRNAGQKAKAKAAYKKVLITEDADESLKREARKLVEDLSEKGTQ